MYGAKAAHKKMDLDDLRQKRKNSQEKETAAR